MPGPSITQLYTRGIVPAAEGLHENLIKPAGNAIGTVLGSIGRAVPALVGANSSLSGLQVRRTGNPTPPGGPIPTMPGSFPASARLHGATRDIPAPVLGAGGVPVPPPPTANVPPGHQPPPGGDVEARQRSLLTRTSDALKGVGTTVAQQVLIVSATDALSRMAGRMAASRSPTVRAITSGVLASMSLYAMGSNYVRVRDLERDAAPLPAEVHTLAGAPHNDPAAQGRIARQQAAERDLAEVIDAHYGTTAWAATTANPEARQKLITDMKRDHFLLISVGAAHHIAGAVLNSLAATGVIDGHLATLGANFTKFSVRNTAYAMTRELAQQIVPVKAGSANLTGPEASVCAAPYLGTEFLVGMIQDAVALAIAGGDPADMSAWNHQYGDATLGQLLATDVAVSVVNAVGEAVDGIVYTGVASQKAQLEVIDSAADRANAANAAAAPGPAVMTATPSQKELDSARWSGGVNVKWTDQTVPEFMGRLVSTISSRIGILCTAHIVAEGAEALRQAGQLGSNKHDSSTVVNALVSAGIVSQYARFVSNAQSLGTLNAQRAR